LYLNYIYQLNMRYPAIIHKFNESSYNKKRVRKQYLLYEVLTETTLVQPIISSSLFTLVYAEYMRY